MSGNRFLRETNKQQNLLRLICYVCHDPNYFNTHGFWGFAFCKTHNPFSWPYCWGCERLKQKNIQFIYFEDGRILCPDCHATAIMDIKKLKPLVEKMYKFYEEKLLRVEKNIPILLVEKDEMRNVLSTTGGSCSPLESWSCGGCTILSLVQGVNARVVNPITSSSVVGGKVCVKKKAQQLTNTPVILLLFGDSEVRLGGALAHEMMHAWLMFQRRRSLGRDEYFPKSLEEEGLCELMSYKWWEWLESNTNFESAYESEWQAQFVRRLIAFCKWKKEMDRREVYGYGFMAAKEAVDKYGLKATLKAYTDTNRLPK